MRRAAALSFVVFILVALGLVGCSPPPEPVVDNVARLAAIPASAAKITPQDDPVPPVMHLSGWGQPVPLPGPVNTLGAEDSPFITPDGSEFYFFFTPDMRIPVQEQLVDGITGIWVARRLGTGWTDPERVSLYRGDCLDGCQVIVGNVMWFASVRPGNLGEIDVYTARREGDRWTDCENAGRQLNIDYDIGESHVTADGQTIYFHSDRAGGLGGPDLYVIYLTEDGWGEPENLGPAVNTAGFDGQPFVTDDGSELWFTGLDRAGYPGTTVWRSVRQPDGKWGVAELVASGFAGEPCLDAQGNLYFVHHIFSPVTGEIVEADIYICERE